MAKKTTTKKAAKKVARKQAAKKAPARKKAPAKAGPALKLNGITSAAVERATGCTWESWIKALDYAGCAKMSHTDIATLLYDKHKVPGWWCQMVAVGYEQAKGIRKPREQAGGFSASVSRTIEAPAAKLTDAFSNSAMREKWLPKSPLEVRTVQKGKSVRGRWPARESGRAGFNPRGSGVGGSSIIAVWITPKGPAKASLQIQHERLTDEADVARAKAFWAGALDRLGKVVAK